MFLPIYLAFAPALTGQVAPTQVILPQPSQPSAEQPNWLAQRTPEDTCPNCIPGRGNIDDIVDDIVDDIDNLPPNPEPPIIRPDTPPPPSILDPTLPAASNQPLPDYAASVSFEILGTTPGTPLAQSPALEDLAILSSILPEPLLLVLTGETSPDPELDLPELVLVERETSEGGTTTLFILQDPSGPDASAPQDPSGPDASAPQDPNGPDVAPSDGPLARLAPISLQNCQDQTRSIQALPGRDRTQSVYQSLISCYEQNLEAATQAQNSLLQSYSLSNLATAYFVTGDYLTAMETYQQQLDVAKASGDRVQEGIALAGVGTTHAALGDYTIAIDYYEQSLSLLTPQDAPQWRSQALRNLGNAYYAQKDYDRAQDYQRQSLQLSHSTGDRYGLMQALGNLGNLYAIAGNYDNALSAYQQSLELAQTLEIPLEIAQAQLGIGTVYAYQRNYAAAYEIYQQSLTAVRALGSRLGEGIALTNVGEALFQLDRLSDAETALVEGVNVWESLRAGLGTHDEFKVSLFETQLTTYRNLQEVLVKQNKAEPALAVAERGRARAFVELLARGKSGATASTPPPTLEQLKEVARDRNATLVEYSIIRAQATELPHGASVQYRQQQDSALFIWVVKPTGEVHFQQVPLTKPDQIKTVAELVQTARSQIKARGFASPVQIKPGDQVTRIGDVPTLAPYTVVSVDAAAGTVTLSHPEITLPTPTVPLAEVSLVGQSPPQNNPWSTGPLNNTAQLQELHELLIEPIAHWLPQDPEAQVIFIPQEQLFLVPFPALKNAAGQFLIEHHTVSTAPAIQVLGLTRGGTSPTAWQQSPLVVGNPSPMPSTFAALPFAEQEAQEIAPILSTQPLLQATATESAVKQQISQASLIHLATHGFFNETQPLQGALALAPVAQQDGLLTADEISVLSLRAELVVLSACDTGRGRITGDGVIGLSRAFLGAGANSVMASLWQVADDSTAVLMVAFYQQLVQGQTKSQALRQAMLTTMESHPDPHDWAAFTVIGAPE